jgi:hypothetical protein
MARAPFAIRGYRVGDPLLKPALAPQGASAPGCLPSKESQCCHGARLGHLTPPNQPSGSVVFR